MSSTYAELKDAIEERLGRDDLTSKLDEFIGIAENMLRRDLRIRLTETSTTLEVSSGTTALPSDFLMLRALSVNDESSPQLDFLPPSQIRENNLFFRGEKPRFYTIEGTNLVVIPAPAEAVDFYITYVAALDALSGSQATNTLTDVAWDLYLYACMFAANSHIGHMDEASDYLQLYNSGIADLKKSEREARRAGGPLKRFVKGAV